MVSALAAAVLSLPGVAGAGPCSASISPDPGWRGATVTISGSGWPAGTSFYVNFGGDQIHNGTTNASGQFSIQYMIPDDFPVGTTNYFVSDNAVTCSTNPDYQVLASPPPTTTSPPPPTTAAPPPPTTTTTTTTTTTIAPTTTVPGTTTTADEDTTTTTEADDEAGVGQGWMLWLIIAVLVVIAAALIWNAKRRRGANSLPPPGNIER